jgi:hypothetical protein
MADRLIRVAHYPGEAERSPSVPRLGPPTSSSGRAALSRAPGSRPQAAPPRLARRVNPCYYLHVRKADERPSVPRTT